MLSRRFLLQHRREQVARAQAEVCVEVGFRQASVDRIVSRAGTSRNTFYELFSNRDDCFVFLLSLASRELLDAVDRAAASGAELDEVIAMGVSAALDWMVQNPAMTDVVLVAAAAGPVEASRAQVALLDALAARLGEAARGRGGPQRLIDQMLVGGAAALMRRLVVDGEIERAPRLAEDIAWFLVRPYSAQAAFQAP